MEDAVPTGFKLVSLGAAFMSQFGPLYLCSETSTLAFRVAPNHLNPVDMCHGGAMATFADLQVIAIRPGADRADQHSPTISLSVDYLAPARLGAWVEADVTLVKSTRTMIFTQALIAVDGNIVARSSAIYRKYGDLCLPVV
ncbi:PaaI family thioesterase [Paraburkholderia sp. USG1]|uniref:PaaI family thioesterase n=1 Tax=Paraburkholderia sp. USG1 TaxID=2952268 RepID=UPI00285D95FE|nr:PaaI family thioesterase [Paraburkholderia sp. USG1]MDR8398385.1 PaaI family thioesterase [Paraburkholderia sp. USG1]